MPIVIIENRDDSFYAMVGPYLANRQTAKEIGYHIYDDDKTRWVLSTANGKLRAFATVRVSGATATVTACYTVEQYRRKGVMKQLLQFAIAKIEHTKFRATANANSLQLFKSLGFKQVHKNGSFVVMELRNA